MVPVSADPATPTPAPIDAQAPIGVFDSGVGGLSVLRHIHAQLPREQLIYVADTAHAPYGGRDEAEIAARALAIGALLQARGVKALVVACNTATALAIAAVRSRFPELIVVGVEPGLKPAAMRSRSRVVGVLATEATLASRRFRELQASVGAATGVRFLARGCPGLADCIERGELSTAGTRTLLETLVLPLLAHEVDTLVLGCTHYPFVLPLIETIIAAQGGADVSCIDTGAAVARHLARTLAGRGMLRPMIVPTIVPTIAPANPAGGAGTAAVHDARQRSICGLTSGSPLALQRAFARLLDWQVGVAAISAHDVDPIVMTRPHGLHR